MNERFSIIRKKLRLSQQQIAEELGVRQASISDIERGKIEISNKIILLLHKKYNISIDWIYTGKGDIFIEKSDNTQKEDKYISEKETDERIREYTNYKNAWGIDDYRKISQVTETLIKMNGYKDIHNQISDFRTDLIACEETIKMYDINFQMYELAEKYIKKQTTKDTISQEFNKKITTTTLLYNLIKPYIKTINELTEQLGEFDFQHEQIFWIDVNNIDLEEFEK